MCTVSQRGQTLADSVVEALKANGPDVRPDDLIDLRKKHR